MSGKNNNDKKTKKNKKTKKQKTNRKKKQHVSVFSFLDIDSLISTFIS